MLCITAAGFIGIRFWHGLWCMKRYGVCLQVEELTIIDVWWLEQSQMMLSGWGVRYFKTTGERIKMYCIKQTHFSSQVKPSNCSSTRDSIDFQKRRQFCAFKMDTVFSERSHGWLSLVLWALSDALKHSQVVSAQRCFSWCHDQKLMSW